MVGVRAACTALLVAAVVGGCSSGADPDQASSARSSITPTTSREATPPPGPTTSVEEAASVDEMEPVSVEWSPCEGGVECTTLEVPLDHTRPDGDTIDLALIRRPAGDPERRIGVLAINPGGPGGSGVDLLTGGFRLGEGLDERFDLVSWDPRGVGASTAVTCGGGLLDDWLALDSSPDTEGELADLQTAAEALADHCGDEDGALLAHVGTEATVEDLDLIRAALGEEQISYLGLSYGTFLGLLYLEAHPERVRAMALDGVMDPAADLPAHARAQAGGFEAAFESMAAWCASAGGCATAEVLDAYDEVAARVEATPLPAGGFPPLGPASLTIATAAALYDPSSWSYLADGLVAALDGDGSLLASLADAYFSGASFTAYSAVVCSDFGPPDLDGFHTLAEEMQTDFPRFGASLAYELLPCAYWPVPPVRSPTPIEVFDEAPPVLLVALTGDPATPLAHAEAVAAQVPSRLIVVDEDGHVAFGSNGCATAWIAEHLVDLVLPDPDETC